MKTGKAAVSVLTQIVSQYEVDLVAVPHSQQQMPEWQETQRRLQLARKALQVLDTQVMDVVFVSGHLDLTEDEFHEHYKPTLADYIRAEAYFVVGDARGADSRAQDFFRYRSYNRVTVYHMLERPRYNAGFATVGGFGSDTERDTAMTQASDVDVAWVRPGRETSGTARNIARRAAVGSLFER